MLIKAIHYKDLKKGQRFPDYTFLLNEDAIFRYCHAVEEDAPVFSDPAIAKKEGYPAVAAPTTAADLYILKGIRLGDKIPSDLYPESQEFEFVHPALAGDIITTKSLVADKFEYDGHKHVIIEVVATNQSGQLIVKSRIDSVWNEQI